MNHASSPAYMMQADKHTAPGSLETLKSPNHEKGQNERPHGERGLAISAEPSQLDKLSTENNQMKELRQDQQSIET